jgi:drug/metabolite transporter (DMT)-like permease
MRIADIVRLIALAAIWGGSFIFMRVLAPVLGPLLTAHLRLLIAGIALLLYFRVIKFDLEWRRFWKQYLIIGAINSAVPFFLFSFAALYIPASLSVILNSTAPFFAALFSAVWLGERLTVTKTLGLIIGAVGVALVVGLAPVIATPMYIWAVAGCTFAAVCYGFAAMYIKKHGNGAKPMGIAGGAQMVAALLLAPIIPFAPVRGDVTITVATEVVVFALLCSAVAYLLYYRLIVEVGPTKALTVTFLMPVFGMLWGATILDERITASMIGGVALIILGTCLVLGVFRRRIVGQNP